MGYVDIHTAAGRGSLSLGGLQTVTEIYAHIVTDATSAQFSGVSPVRRVHHQCWYGLAGTAPAGPAIGQVVITFGRYLFTESEDFVRPVGWLGSADTLYWDIEAGGVMWFEVDWP